MCLAIDRTLHSEKFRRGFSKIPKYFIADTDLIVYKVLKEYHYEPPFQYKTPCQCVTIEFNDGRAILESDLIASKFPFKIEKSSFTGIYKYNISNGIHSYIHFDENMNLSVNEICNRVVKFAIIPKGSKYYVGIGSDIVSDRLIIFEDKESFNRYKKTNFVKFFNY